MCRWSFSPLGTRSADRNEEDLERTDNKHEHKQSAADKSLLLLFFVLTLCVTILYFGSDWFCVNIQSFPQLHGEKKEKTHLGTISYKALKVTAPFRFPP